MSGLGSLAGCTFGPMQLELSALGAVRPPAEAVLAGAARREAQGFDAVWWIDHLLHWFPDSVWTEDLVPQAATQASPHVFLDPFPLVAAAAGATEHVRLGVGVTDLVRRHPAQLAQTAITLDHVTGGRFLLGVGTGEDLNIGPIGMTNERPLGRLEEGLAVMRALWASPDPIDFDGDHFQLRGMALGAPLFGETPPEIWLAAHRPRGLRLTGAHADGWLPLVTDLEEYRSLLGELRTAEAASGRAPGSVTAGLYARVVIAAEDGAAAAAMDDSFLLRFITLTRPDEAFAARGAEHPLGAGTFGLTSFNPVGLGREDALSLAEAVPGDVVRDTAIHGTPAQVAEQLAEFAAAGAEHIQLTNMTPLAAPALAAESEALLGETVAQLRGSVRNG